MGEWKKWLNADYAFSNNGEKIKKVIKATYTISLVLFFIAAAIGLIGVLVSMFDGAFEYVWYVPFIIIVAILLAPFLIYWSLSTLYGFGELVANSYGNGGGRVVETVIEEKANRVNPIENIAKFFKKYAKIIAVCLVLLLLAIVCSLAMNNYDKNNLSKEEAISAAKDEIKCELEQYLDDGEYIDYEIYRAEEVGDSDKGIEWFVKLKAKVVQEWQSYFSGESVEKSYFVYLDDNEVVIYEI